MVMKNNVFRKIMELLPILLIIGLFAALAYSIFYSSKLEEQIWERDKTIRELSFRSKLVEDYFDIEYNPDDSLTFYTLKDSIKNIYAAKKTIMTDDIKNYTEIAMTLDTVIKQHNKLINEYNDLVQKYNSLIREQNSISKEKNIIKNNNRKLEDVLKMIERRYKISYNITIDSTIETITLKNTDMVDSGLMLLPYYRDKIVRESNGTWVITYTKNRSH